MLQQFDWITVLGHELSVDRFSQPAEIFQYLWHIGQKFSLFMSLHYARCDRNYEKSFFNQYPIFHLLLHPTRIILAIRAAPMQLISPAIPARWSAFSSHKPKRFFITFVNKGGTRASRNIIG
jgi:hypothetical protein